MLIRFARRKRGPERGTSYQSDVWLFQYHPDGLAHSDNIEAKKGSRHRFNADLNRILAVTPYAVDNDIMPAERFDRLERFVSEMACLKIPNPYSVFELLRAKSRWIDLGREAGWSPVETMMALNS